MKLIKVTLSGWLQSWREDSRWDDRYTTTMPTKSGIIGMIGAAFGYKRGDPHLNDLNNRLRIAVRADRTGSMEMDYHTATYPGNGQWKCADGENDHAKTLVFHKEYLVDAWFTVYLWGDEDLLGKVYNALYDPKYPLFLGSKCCIPSVPIIPNWVYASSPKEAVVKNRSDLAINECDRNVQIQMDVDSGDTVDDERIVFRKDNIFRADLNEYLLRQVKIFSIIPQKEWGEPA